jgi:hypothetical protein
MSTIDILQTLGIIFSLGAAIYQMRLYIKAEKISIVTRISERNDALLNDLLSHIEEVRNFCEPFKAGEGVYFSDPRVSIMYRILNFWDEMFYYRKQEYMDDGTWQLYRRTLHNFVDNPFAASFWEHVRGEYNPRFQEYVDSCLKEPA